MATELLQQVRVIDPVSETDQVSDVLIVDGDIQAISLQISDVSSDTSIRDCRGLVLGTGLVDLYSHSGEPGFEERETLVSFLAAAAAGGFTRVAVLPDTSPVIDNPALVAQLQKPIKLEQNLDFPSPLLPCSPAPLLQIWGAMTLDLAGKQLAEFADLATAGVVGFTDAKPWENLGIVQRMLEYLQPFGKPVAFCPCDRSLSLNGMMREGAEALRVGLPPVPASAETSAIASLLELVAAIGTPVHIMRVSTARSVELIATAKFQGLPVTASTTWMHLLLDTRDVKSYHTSLHLEPPLGNPSDVTALRNGLRGGVIDAIAIDHAPYTYEEKVQAFAESPPGAIGLELALPLLWQNLVATEEFTPLELWRVLSNQPAACLQQKINPIKPGEKAELTLFDPLQSWKINRANLHTLSNNTPWFGQEIQGRVLQTWC
ncbi:dihydroorotase [Anabaena cylindrica FACHB-243]|uniref:Dihydroorotase n=1 Tax=Anabaena cylindrica (strain ATCC 27899 / PCC 7122) TaxID=272123 RepID=K9ZH61_ANACC|nr:MULTISPECIES: dihydroorotase [Anabaena]AFZ58526.1 dihydroorotase [Anabaena cylindrica PCC 7122]MBD2416289.1 dihydroorotase [Anabaena cylindrica FACHB-243]MBY5283278.1 dihydroorotase [Anabaena sp. CCAP 1446/1C]MBY5307959.1 dihydroorotase [Anabaena sp. CCAP 1446/1C]MCM2407332.1 dihydroorotase [Anabaena sp. CCAP 1446/1C]